jgi:hypothetical protein
MLGWHSDLDCARHSAAREAASCVGTGVGLKGKTSKQPRTGYEDGLAPVAVAYEMETSYAKKARPLNGWLKLQLKL